MKIGILVGGISGKTCALHAGKLIIRVFPDLLHISMFG